MRYLPLTPDDRSAMLAAIGAKSIDDLFVDVPAAARPDGFVDLPRVADVLRRLNAVPGGTEKLVRMPGSVMVPAGTFSKSAAVT